MATVTPGTEPKTPPAPRLRLAPIHSAARGSGRIRQWPPTLSVQAAEQAPPYPVPCLPMPCRLNCPAVTDPST